MLKQGDTYGGCCIISRCGHGASGTVYLAEDAMGRRVAIKVFDSPEAGERELKGIRHYMSLRSPSSSLIAIYHVGIEDGQLYYVMEAADNAADDGEEYVADTLALRMKRHGQFQPQEAFHVVQHLLDGLETLHNAHLIHRDIKPENILFIKGQPCLGDPGVVGDFSHTLSLAGSLGFIPPELFNAAAKPSPNTDLYALGKVLYCLVTGRNAGDFPSMPQDMPYETLMQVCLPLERMCNRDPSRRCLACSDFRKQLQEAMVVRHGFVRFLWRLRGDRAFVRRCLLWSVCAIIALLCLVFGAFSWHRHHLRQQEIAALRHETVAAQLSTLRERRSFLELQLESLQETLPWEATFKAAETALAQKDAQKAEEVLGKITEQLRNIALRHRPPRITSNELNAETIRQNGRQFGYLASPLGKWYLSQEARQVLQNEAESDAKALFADGRVVAGKAVSFANGVPLKFQFVPPGRFMSPVTHTVQEIDAPYWILETELSVRQFKRHVLWPSGENDLSELPMTGLTLNDMLVFCKHVFDLMKSGMDLPPGYALRLPTEAEWEYAALGGSTGSLPPARVFTKEEKVLCAVGSGEPNALGLYQMDANVPEVALPYPETNVDEEYVAWRGGSFKRKKSSIVERTLERRDQMVVRDCGLRVVLAPTPDDYYRKTFYYGSRLRHAQLHGKEYAGFGSCTAILTYNNAMNLAKALGARFPEPASMEEAGEIIQALNLDKRYPMTTGIAFTDGAWRRFSDNAIVTLPKLKTPAPNSIRLNLGMTGKIVYTTSSKSGLPSIVMEWENEEAFRNRKQLPCDKVIEANHRRYGLVELNSAVTAIPALLELTRHTSPVFKSREELEELLKALSSYDAFPIALGYVRYDNEWIGRDGTGLPWINGNELEHNSTSMMSVYNQFLVVHQGKLKSDYMVAAILVELP